MFFIYTLEDTVRIPPKMFGKPLAKSVYSILQERYNSKIDPRLGHVVMTFSIKVDGSGLVSSNGTTVHKVQFDALVFHPKAHEIVRGEIIEMADFGAFVRIGSTDAVLHLSQISHGASVDVKAGTIRIGGGKSTLRIGSRVRSRISAVSMSKDSSIKIGLTCSEPTLGPEDWNP